MEKTSGLETEKQDEVLRLLTEIREGKDAAFNALLSKYEGLLRRRVAAVCRQDAAKQDAYQEACLALHRAALHYVSQDTVTFGLYAKICVDNALKTKYKQDARRTAVLDNGEQIDFVPFEDSDFFAPFFDRMEEKEKAEELLSQIRSFLSPYEARVFSLYIADVPPKEIAARLCKDEKSVKNAMDRLLRKLRRVLNRE